MTILRAAAAVLLAVAGALVLPSPASAAGATIVVRPGHGTANTSFTITYRYPDLRSGFRFCDTGIDTDFRWEGLHLATAPVIWDKEAGECVSTVTTKPIQGALWLNAGSYEIAVLREPKASTMFTIDVGSSPNPRTKAPTRAAPTRGGTPTTAAASPSPVVATQSEPAAATSPAGGSPSGSPETVRAGDTVPTPASGVPWLLGGVALVVAGGATVFVLRRFRVRGRPG